MAKYMKKDFSHSYSIKSHMIHIKSDEKTQNLPFDQQNNSYSQRISVKNVKNDRNEM